VEQGSASQKFLHLVCSLRGLLLFIRASSPLNYMLSQLISVFVWTSRNSVLYRQAVCW